MSFWTPPRLLDIVGMNLLREEALVFSAVEDRPTELFPPLLMEAFHGRCIETLKAMVQAWPFVHLPLGDLIDMPHVGGPYKQCWKSLMSCLPRRFNPGESDSGSLVKSGSS